MMREVCTLKTRFPRSISAKDSAAIVNDEGQERVAKRRFSAASGMPKPRDARETAGDAMPHVLPTARTRRRRVRFTMIKGAMEK